LFNRLNLPAYTLWVNGNDKLVAKQQIKWKGKLIPLSEASAKIHSLPALKDRHALAALVYGRFKEIADFAEAELNAVITNKKIEDELRGHSKPYSATIMEYENEEETVEKLVATVTKHFPIAHRFYNVKAKMLGLKQLAYVDRSAPIGKTVKKFTFNEAIAIVRRAFTKVAPVYAEAFDEMLVRGQVDVFSKVGKEGGAFCSHYKTLPIFVLLNYITDFHSVTTLAHEMGHALHSKFSTENQSPLYRDYTMSAAEVASTLFENFVFDEVFATLSAKEQIIALHDKINDSVSTIFRQIAFFNFELELHTQIRAKGSLPKEEIAKLLTKHNQACLGPMFKFKDEDGYFFVSFPHIRYFFYVYSYAFGEIVSSAMYQKYQEDKGFEQQIRHFLSAGGSASPEDIFAGIGIDVRNPAFFELGLKKIEADIEKLEKLVQKGF
jgi:oligoendopeptidase F